MREPVMAPASGTQWRRERRAIGRVRGCVCRCMSLRVSPVAIDRGRKGRRRGEPWSGIELGRVWDVTREAPAFGMRVHGAWSVCWQTEEEAGIGQGQSHAGERFREEWNGAKKEREMGNGKCTVWGRARQKLWGRLRVDYNTEYSSCPTALSMLRLAFVPAPTSLIELF